MAVETVRKGAAKFEATCGRCGATFAYQISDLHRDYVHGGERVGCPSCGESHRHMPGWGTRTVRGCGH